ncbi:MAG: hypothetical protein JSS42_08520 [Proteobacteria bacterium]|nr:hypothetical protein [Pseudomonadota bacterium]
MSLAPNPSPDRLFDLLPAFHRSKDSEQGYPLRALLRVINEQVCVVENDIARLRDDWFIETCADWAVAYIGDLVGYQPVHEAGDPGDPATTEGRRLNSWLIPRREVANTIALRRRKGTLSALTELIEDVAAWPGFAEEFYRRLGWTQHLNHRHPHRGRVLGLRDADALDRIGTAFDRSARSVDVRRIDSRRRHGRYNIPSVGAFVFRMKSYPVTGTSAYCLEKTGPQCFSFSVLGNDAPLYTKPQPEVAPATEATLPVPIRRQAFQVSDDKHPPTVAASPTWYGVGKSFAIYAPDWPSKNAEQPIPIGLIVPADLSGWAYQPKRNTVAVDPQLGRVLFPAGQLPKKGVSVDYRYGFVADIGGGEYARPIHQPTLAQMSRFRTADIVPERIADLAIALSGNADALGAYLRGRFAPATLDLIDRCAAIAKPASGTAGPLPDDLAAALIVALVGEFNALLEDDGLYSAQRFPSDPARPLPAEVDDLLGAGATGDASARLNRLLLEYAYAKDIALSFAIYRVGKGQLARIADALTQFNAERPRYGIIEFSDSGVYAEAIDIALAPYQTLQMRAAERTRPVLRMLDYQSGAADAFAVAGGDGSRFVLDGVLVAGRGLQITGPDSGDGATAARSDLCEVVIRHCTLVPGWSLDCDCEPKRPNEPSIELINTRAALVVEHSIIGSIEITADPALGDPLVLRISDSIVDATHSGRIALGASEGQYAFAEASILRCTVLGAVRTHALALAGNSIFMGCIHVARSQRGCVRFCYVTPNSRTPKRYHCQPDLVRAQVAADHPDLSAPALAAAQEPESMRVRPTFDSTRYGNPAYCRLACDCAQEIARGADDGSEMGVYHDLFQPQREIGLQTRLREYTPAGMDAGVILAN